MTRFYIARYGSVLLTTSILKAWRKTQRYLGVDEVGFADGHVGPVAPQNLMSLQWLKNW
jgi:hypothetical protein